MKHCDINCLILHCGIMEMLLYDDINDLILLVICEINFIKHSGFLLGMVNVHQQLSLFLLPLFRAVCKFAHLEAQHL